MALKSFNLFLNFKIPKFRKTINVDPDKSISIRSFLIGSICQKISTINNVLESMDVKSAISACRELGVKSLEQNLNLTKFLAKVLGLLMLEKS